MTFDSGLSLLSWAWVTRLGEAQFLLPLAVGAAAWLAWKGGQRTLALRWMGALGVAVAVTTASKLAFMGWGLGWAPWDFTGFSGHSMFAAATLPLLAATALQGRRWALWLGWGLAVLVAWSRVRVGAHSVSESVLGCLLGSAATLVALRGGALLSPRLPPWLAPAMVALLVWLPFAAPASFTHDWVIRLSLQLSGRSHPYTRQDLHRGAHDAARLSPAVAREAAPEPTPMAPLPRRPVSVPPLA